MEDHASQEFKANVILDNENTELQGKITDLQENNEKLKELCDKYEEEHSTTFEYWKSEINKISNGDDKK